MKKIFTLLAFLSVYLCAQSQAWIELGTGDNALNANNSIWSIIATPGGDIYAAGGFSDSTVYYGGHSYVAKWNGTAWSEVGALNANNAIYSLAQDQSGNIYAAGNFIDSNGRQYVAQWNGISWNELGIDTIGLNATAPIYALTTDATGNVYAAGAFTDLVFAYNHYYVAKWNGSMWSEVGLDSIYGLNADSSILALATDAAGNIYAAGAFTDSLGYSYVAKWNGTVWSKLGNDSSALNANGTVNAMITDTAGNIYVGGTFTDSSGYYYIAKWNGIKWTELSNPATNQINILGPINALTLDSAGNVYAGGMIPDTNGNFFFVVVWNGSQIIVADNSGSAPLDANAPVLTMTSDSHGNIYAAGNFNDDNFYQYVAEFTSNIPAGIHTIASGHLYVYPNPSSGVVFIQADHLSGTSSITVIDDLGRAVYTANTEGATLQTHIDISDLATGVYTLLLHDETGDKLTRRIVKE